VNAGLVAKLMADDLGGRELWIEIADLSVPDELNASYTIEVRLSQEEAEPAACLDVHLEVLDGQAPDLRLADVDARSGGCD
jgi:hypothetical protein